MPQHSHSGLKVSAPPLRECREALSQLALITPSSKLFSKSGYSVALIARGTSGTIQKLAEELNAAGGDVSRLATRCIMTI